MNKEELEKEIAKFKARKSKTRLAYYALIISILLALSTLGNGVSVSSLISFLLVLPLPLYFGLQSLKLTAKLRHLKAKSVQLVSLYREVPSRFSLATFLTQPNVAFRLSLTLLFLICLTTLARLRTPEPTISLSAPAVIHTR